MESVNVTMDIRSAAVVRHILFEHQKGYSYEFPPERINDVRNVIQEIDKRIEEQITE